MLNLPSAADDTAAEQAPPDGILDRAGLFQRNPEIRANIAGHLRQLREERGFLIYVLIESVFVQGNPQTMATELREKWIPDGNGLVFVFEVDSRRFSVGQKLEQTVARDGSIEGIPSYVTTAVLAQASAEVRKNPLEPEAFLDVFVTRVAEGLNGYFRRKESPLPEGRTLRLGMIVIGGAAALALLGMAAAWLLRRSDRGSSGCFFFPETEAGERLGAPYGGGEVSSRRFGRGGEER